MSNNIVITPGHCLDPQIAIAACRTGETGIVDLGYREGPDAVIPVLNRLAFSAGRRGRWGVRWDTLGSPSRGVENLSKFLPVRVPILIIGGLRAQDLQFADLKLRELVNLKKKVKGLARQIMIEVYDLQSARMAIAAGCDGLIIKGHEAGGWVSRHSSFILLQELCGQLKVPYWIQGGIGLHSAAAAMQAGATGVVLCEQLWLADESPFANILYKKAWSQLDGSEAVLFGPEDRLFRLFSRSGRGKLKELEQALVRDEPWQDLLHHGLCELDDPLISMGQDIAFAGPLAKRYGTVGRILAALSTQVDSTLKFVKTQKTLSPDSPLAQIHGTRFPIVQGPMTRVSDVAPFAQAVADGGGLPFVALSVMHKPQVHKLLTETKALLGDRPWGVGILGFMPLELRQEQLDEIREVKPPFAIIAGGRPSQAREFEALGISTYLHVPSPGLLQGFIKEGARKFIFEGSECGGHTGPRTSFILWESAIETLTTVSLEDPESVQVLFAGGIHDALSAAMVTVLAVPLVARGMKVGVVMGTAYLFTEEIVRTGAAVKEFQSQAIACEETSLLQSGVGIYTRCATTPFCDEFNRTRRNFLLAMESEENILKLLELLNIGRLRIASKGLTRNSELKEGNGGDRYLWVDTQTQRREGMYMLGEVARLRNKALSIAELHAEVSVNSGAMLTREVKRPITKRAKPRANHEDIAIIGMACMLPKAADLRTYWQNIVNRVDAIREVSDDRWRPADFFDPKRGAPDKVNSKWGGFLDDFQFDPGIYGIAPASLSSIEPMQLLALEVSRLALEDAGFNHHPFPRERTATIFAQGGMNDLGTIYIFRTLLAQYLPKVPGLSEPVKEHIMKALYEHELPKYTEDSFPGILGNVVAGRVANRLDLQGANFTVDAACAASLAALDAGIRQLRSGDADVALVGAVDGNNNATSFMNFAQTHALSPRGHCRSFDDSADGIALGEGVAALVLKRLGDAERDGDRIYAVIKGIGSSSDGRNRSMTAPHPQGQVTALRRAYQDAGVDPATVGLIEAHATGTAVGDRSEIEALNLAFGSSSMATQSCAVGSVKSMIGHTKVTAGLAGMIKSALALKHRVLTPTIGVDVPNTRIDFSKSPFFVNTETRPWLASPGGHPRRCGVSGFGFGGTNFHVVLEEYGNSYRDSDTVNLDPRDAEPFIFWAPDRLHIEQAVESLLQKIIHPEHIDLAQLAYSVHTEQRRAKRDNGMRRCRLALLAASSTDLKQKLTLALNLMHGGQTEIKHPQGVYYQEGTAAMGVCFLFPGQGSQKINMLRDLVAALPELYDLFENADAVITGSLPQALSRFIYPLPVFSDEERTSQQTALNATQVAQPALGVVELAALRILKTYGIQPDFVAGHSYGEYVALCAAGVIQPDDLIRISEIRGRLSAEAGQNSPGAMAAVDADGARVTALIEQHGLAVSLANLNSPDQTIISGSIEAIDAAAAILRKELMRVTKLPVSAAFHSPAMASASTQLAAELARIEFKEPQIPVFSNTTALSYPNTAHEARELLARHLTESVRFVDEINHLHEAGARIFVEVGPGLVLSGLVDRILAGRPHAALGIDAPGRPGWLQLGHLLTQLFALGVPVSFETWFKGRSLKEITPEEVFAAARAKAEPNSMVWRVNGGRAIPWSMPAELPKSVVPLVPAETAGMENKVPTPQPEPRATAPIPDRRTYPRSTRVNKRLIPQRRLTMVVNNEALSSAALPHQGNGAGSTSHLMQVQRSVAQLLDLQRAQQETLRYFLEFQTNLIGADWQGIAANPDWDTQPAHAQPEARLASPRGQVAARAPVLPQKILDTHAGWSAAEMSHTAQPIAAAIVKPSPVTAAPPSKSPGNNGSSVSSAQITAVKTDNTANNGAGVARGSLPPAEQFKADLLRAVSERTGYPEDMLDLNAHMEADLGIDSIKRIEVFSGLKDNYNFMEGRDEETVFEELAGHKTLNEIINWYDQLCNPVSLPKGASSLKKAQTPSSLAETVESQNIVTPDSVHCYYLMPVAAPLNEEIIQEHYSAGFQTLLLGPLSELTEAFKAALINYGYPVQHIIPGNETRLLGDNRLEVDFSSLESSQRLRGLLANSDHMIGAIINLSGLPAAQTGTDKNRHLEDAKVLFLLSKVLEHNLKDVSHQGGGWLINVTAIDGQFGLSQSRDFPAEMAGTLGVAKSIAQEWPAVRVKCIDVDPELESKQLIEHVLSEWRCQDPTLEIGFTREGRWKLDLQLNDADASKLSRLELDNNAVVLVTGGAYGITANIAKVLAERYQPRLILVGRSPMPEPESAETRELRKPAELKQFLINDLRAKDAGKVKPADVDRVFKRILKDRDILANLASMRATGAEVEYHALDLRDAEAFESLIDQIYAKWGRIDGVLHGAGIIDDKLVRDKTLESFEPVYQTKVIPAQVMASRLRPDNLKFLVLFSSIAGRFGNSGQCDYSAANEVLNKLADCLSCRWPQVHTVSINWGPWAAGMVNNELLKIYAARDILPIPLDTGTRFCIEELERGNRGESEILITASLKQIAGLMRRKPRPEGQGFEKVIMAPAQTEAAELLN
ncbi:MAG: SDR family NAD(P)-dependent oxidoreductase [Methylobacter sp.]|nr:SDR family NAD(P)-dependent oxidoreductase [Methylobacter sp.]